MGDAAEAVIAPLSIEPIASLAPTLSPLVIPVADAIEFNCWKCANVLRERVEFCPGCGAYLAPQRAITRVEAAASDSPLVRVIIFFMAWLVISLAQAFFLFGHQQSPFGISQRHSADNQLNTILIAEAIDTVLVVLAIYKVGRPRRPQPTAFAVRLAVWMTAIPGLVVLLALNFAYHHVVNNFIRFPFELEDCFERRLLIWVVIAICVQPAIVEELFFRYLALGAFREIMGIHGAVWISAIMFGLAHIFVPLSVPMLTLVGVGLGYARVWSGGMALPMILHALHNAAVLAMSDWK
jgi:membrane protease YdiL (CAAX protease family)